MESVSFTPGLPLRGGGNSPTVSGRGVPERRGDPLGKHRELPQASKECPQPQELVALGFWKTNPEPRRSFTKSTTVPFR